MAANLDIELYNAVWEDDAQRTLELLSAGANIEAFYEDKKTPLHFAAEGRNPETIKILLAGGANIESLTKDKETPLHFAAWFGEPETIKILLAGGANIESLTKDKETPLHFAARLGQPETIKNLLAGGASIKSLSKFGQTALDCAIMNGQSTDSVHCMLDHIESKYSLEDMLRLAQPMYLDTGAVKWPAQSPCVDIVRRRIIRRVLSEGEDAKDVPITVIGPAGAGKSTLIEVLQQAGVLDFLVRLLRGKETCADRGSLDLFSRTKGISVVSFMDSLGNILHFKDLAGQEDFAACHSIFDLSMDGPSAALIVVNGCLPLAQLNDDLALAAGRLISRGSYDARTGERHVLAVGVVFTRADPISAERKKELVGLYRQLQRDTKGYLSLEFYACIDARRSRQPSTGELRSNLSSLCTKLLKGAKQPAFLRKFCTVMDAVQRDLRKPFTTMDEFARTLHKHLGTANPGQATDIVRQNIQLMATLALIVTFKDSPRLQDLVVSKPSWLLHDVVGAIFSPEEFPGPRVTFDNGIVSKEQFIADLRECAPGEGDVVADMVVSLGLVIEKGTMIIAPGKLPPSKRILGSWETGDTQTVHCGLSFTCLSLASFPAGFVTRLLARLYTYFASVHGNHTVKIWSNIINVRPSSSPAEGLVRFEPTMRKAWIITRAPFGSEHHAFYLLELLHRQFAEEAVKIGFSPPPSARGSGVENTQSSLPYSIHVVSPTSVTQQLEEANATLHRLDTHSTTAEIAGKKGYVLVSSFHYGHKELVSSLHHFQPGHLAVISDHSRSEIEDSLTRSDVHSLAQNLHMPPVSDAESAFELLQRWALREFGQTTRLVKILSSCERNYSNLLDVLRKEEEWLSKALPDVFAYQQKVDAQHGKLLQQGDDSVGGRGDERSAEVAPRLPSSAAPASRVSASSIGSPVSITSSPESAEPNDLVTPVMKQEPAPRSLSSTGMVASKQVVSTGREQPVHSQLTAVEVFDTPGGKGFYGWCLRLDMDSFRNQALTSGAINLRQQSTLTALAVRGPEVHNAKLLVMVAEGETVEKYRALAATVNALGHHERCTQFMTLLEGCRVFRQNK